MTATVRSLGYVVIGTTDLAAWRTFAPQVLGMELVEHTETSLRFRMDEFGYRFQVEEGAPEGVHTLGWGVKGADELTELIAHIEKYGYTVTRHGQGSELAAARNVKEVATLSDPDGLTIELFHAFEEALTPFVSPVGTSFVADRELGMGHIFQMVSDPEKYNEFYRDVLGFRLSDYIGPATFYHCNPRHHSFAFVPAPKPEMQRVHHIMMETTDLDGVGRAIDAMKAAGAPETATLGKHTNDKMISFYVQTPSKVSIEYGTGGIFIDDETWVPTQYSSAHYWGHDREDA
ncbi:VOC family protein [Nocardioides sp. Kera G14]|uniref:VOC family protein n=1 Tax=Nocardioides sp. Kera G14 TaxID=2884264 RepID=UPI001D0FFB0F|nr:VOC family protein [Nocardioides sp. Kera G14]UDY24591.1 VOC family protein [Nocardioides sp. Kera G14]